MHEYRVGVLDVIAVASDVISGDGEVCARCDGNCVFAIFRHKDRRYASRFLGQFDEALCIDTGRSERRAEHGAESVVTDCADEGGLRAEARGGDGLVRAFAAGDDGETGALQRFARFRTARDAGDEVGVDAADDDDAFPQFHWRLDGRLLKGVRFGDARTDDELFRGLEIGGPFVAGQGFLAVLDLATALAHFEGAFAAASAEVGHDVVVPELLERGVAHIADVADEAGVHAALCADVDVRPDGSATHVGEVVSAVVVIEDGLVRDAGHAHFDLELLRLREGLGERRVEFGAIDVGDADVFRAVDRGVFVAEVGGCRARASR